ncbi:hypothetical protein BTVI_136969 [Pitangus sulphuratus]|nr:hypothetical protein BTVI_136969 [Pitangus sulphuratus]
MTLVLSLSSSLPNPKVCRRVEEHLETGWAAPGAKLSAELVFFFLCLKKSSWCLTEQKKQAGLEQDPILQIFLLEEKLKQYCKVSYKIKVYPGQVHGFAQLKPEDMKPDDKPYIEEARKDMIDWIKMFV